MVAVHDVVLDATLLLDWSGGGDASLLDEETEEQTPVVASSLADSYRAAIEQAREQAFTLALTTLRGENSGFPPAAVLALLEMAGWTDALRDFKLQVLEHNGRSEVMDVARGGQTGGGRIRRKVFKGFIGALNAALDSLSGLPGVGVIKELKDFLEGSLG
jgi:hypothetical protein